jgi:hypothetical protein
MKEEEGGDMRFAITGTVLALLLLQSFAYAEEEEQIRVLTGELSTYGYRAVVVDGEKIDLCDEYEVLDTLDKPITIDGLIATEIATVTIRKSCAIQVKAEKIRR